MTTITTLDILINNPDTAYTPSELAALTGLSEQRTEFDLLYALAYGAIRELPGDRWQVEPNLNEVKRVRSEEQ